MLYALRPLGRMKLIDATLITRMPFLRCSSKTGSVIKVGDSKHQPLQGAGNTYLKFLPLASITNAQCVNSGVNSLRVDINCWTAYRIAVKLVILRGKYLDPYASYEWCARYRMWETSTSANLHHRSVQHFPVVTCTSHVCAKRVYCTPGSCGRLGGHFWGTTKPNLIGGV